MPQQLYRKGQRPALILRYFEKPLGDDAFIDVSDGISSVADLKVVSYDGRPFSRHFNGSLTIEILKDSQAVRENRRGLEEGDDLTELIETFVKECVFKAVSEVEEEQRKREKERRRTASSEKMKELSRFLRKCDMKFKFELKELKRRALKTVAVSSDEDVEDDSDELDLYRRPTLSDPPEILVRGRWITQPGSFGGDGQGTNGIPVFVPDPAGPDSAVKIGSKSHERREGKKAKEGLQVVLSDDPNYPDRPVFSEYDDPVSDRDMTKKRRHLDKCESSPNCENA